MSAFTERFNREVSFSEEMKAYHVRVNGRLLTDDDKGKLLTKYEREMMKPVLGWKIAMSGIASRIVPVYRREECDATTFVSFTKAKTHLAKTLQNLTDEFRAATVNIRKLLKADVVAASVVENNGPVVPYLAELAASNSDPNAASVSDE